jgi:hypothetical protein
MTAAEWFLLIAEGVAKLIAALANNDDEAELQAQLLIQRRVATKKAELKFQNLKTR